MKRLNVFNSLAVLFVFSVMVWGFVPSAALGAVPQLINFQGVLKDGSGNPVLDNPYSVTFTIYDAATGGNNLWTETQSVSTTDGLFAVFLGASNPVPDSAFNNANRWLGTKVGADPEMTPRQQLVSVPYSFRVAHFIPEFGLYNTFIGRSAGNLTMTGTNNTASGASVLQSNTIGSDNTASGVYALSSNTTGFQNTASGTFALASNTTGGSNTASGVSALQNNTTGFFNTASGTFALAGNTTGFDNTASGVSALSSNTSGGANTASGLGALSSNTTGGSNTASGAGALQNNTTGGSNTGIGFAADVSAGNLTNATAIGAGAVVDASNKIRLGNNVVTLVETDGNIKVGADDTVFTSNLSSNSPLSFQAPAGTTRMFISDATGNVGIGTTSPSVPLHVNSSSSAEVGRFQSNTAQPYLSLWYGTFEGARIQTVNDVSDGGSLRLFTAAPPFGSVYERMRITSDGNVGIGTISPNNKLHVVGSSQIDGDVDIRSSGKLILRNPGYAELYSNNMKIAGGSTFTFDHLGVLSANWAFNDGNVGIGTTSPGASNLLELSSTTKGFVLPRMTKAQRDAIASPVAGMAVYQTDNTPGLRVYNGTNWMRFTETAD